jgi:hypothetical protein
MVYHSAWIRGPLNGEDDNISGGTHNEYAWNNILNINLGELETTSFLWKKRLDDSSEIISGR